MNGIHPQSVRDLVQRLWNQPLHASAISAELYKQGIVMSREAVIGLVNRMRKQGIPMRERPRKWWHADSRPLADTKRPSTCQWDGCRCARERGSYCGAHAERVYQPRTINNG